MPKRLVIFDGNNLLYRSFFAIKELSNNGIATNGVFGALKSFKATVQELKPDYVIVVWDSGKKTFRHEQDATYKANRPETHDDLKSQFPMIKEAFDVLHIPQIVADGVECDDMIGTIAEQSSRVGIDVIIASSDKDFYQLCDDHISVYSFTVKKKDGNGLVNADYVRANFGVEPKQLVDIKALTGERGDNIAGVKGIGPKTATKLIQEWGTVFKAMNVICGNTATNPRYKLIADNVDVVFNAYNLALIKTDCPIPPVPVAPVEKLKVNVMALREYFERYNMSSFLRELGSWQYLFSYKVKVS